MLNDGNALIHAGVLVAIVWLLYHFFIKGNFGLGNMTSAGPVDNGLAGYPSSDGF